MAGKPGVMLYFSLRPALSRLSIEEKGRLFEAILDYGEYGVLPSLEDSLCLAMAWEFLRPLIEKDNSNYEGKVKKTRYAAYCREADRTGSIRLPFSEWEMQLGTERHQATSGDIR
jgi:hypothetical protein